MKKYLFYITTLFYVLLSEVALAETETSVHPVIQDEPVQIQTVAQPVVPSIDTSNEVPNTTEVTLPATGSDTLQSNTLPAEEAIVIDESTPDALSTKQYTDSEPTIVETVEAIAIEVIPEPVKPFQPSTGNQKILIPEYIIYEAARPDLTITYPNPHTEQSPWFLVGARTQSMKHFDAWGRLIKEYPVSTAKKGVGEIEHSYQTPRGHHKICEKIGDGLAPRTIISRRQPTEWFYTEELHKEYPKKDWILTRILWLCGQEEGKNKGYNAQGKVVDSYRRYIYIHGAGDHAPFGVAPSSLGCVRMNSEDVIDVFSKAPIGTDVVIDETR